MSRGYDHMPVSRGYMRPQYPLLMAPSVALGVGILCGSCKKPGYFPLATTLSAPVRFRSPTLEDHFDVGVFHPKILLYLRRAESLPGSNL